jgi:hypothetical protein
MILCGFLRGWITVSFYGDDHVIVNSVAIPIYPQIGLQPTTDIELLKTTTTVGI